MRPQCSFGQLSAFPRQGAWPRSSPPPLTAGQSAKTQLLPFTPFSLPGLEIGLEVDFLPKEKGLRNSSKPLNYLAGTTRLELATSGVTGRRSNQLNYAPDGVFKVQSQGIYLEKFLSIWDIHPLVAGSRAAGGGGANFHNLTLSQGLIATIPQHSTKTLNLEL